MRDNIIFYAGIFGLYIVFSTEILSLFNSINRSNIIIFWSLGFFFSIFFLRKNFFIEGNQIIENLNNNKLISSIVIFILLITFFISFFYLPTNGDAMSYRLPRVLTWIQNSNIDFFSTPDQRQLFMPPFTDYLILHLYLLNNDIFLANFTQWLAMFFSLITVSSITKELGGSKKAQILSVFMVITIPMGILQSTSMQTDYIVAFWFLNFIYFTILYKKKPNLKNLISLSIALGLGILTKQNMYLFSLPFLLLLFYNFREINKKKFLGQLFILGIIVISINYTHLSRTYDLYGNLTSSHPENIKLLNEKISPKYFSSNIIRNLSLNLTLPNKSYNEKLRNGVKFFHQKIGISITDSKNTFGKDFYIYFSTYEAHASNTLHFLSYLICMIIIFSNKKYFF